MAEETKPLSKDVPAKGWDRKVRHLGTYLDFRKREWPAYLEFQDVEGEGRGFGLFCTSTHKEFKPGARFLNDSHLEKAKVKFAFSGKTEHADKPKAPAISKAKRNAAIAAAAPKSTEDSE